MSTADFEVELSTPLDEDVEVHTGFDVSQEQKRVIETAMQKYNALDRPEIYSVSTAEGAKSAEIALAEIDSLAVGLNTSLDKTVDANRIILRYANSDPLMGFAYSTIMANVPTDFDVVFTRAEGDEEDADEYAKIKQVITEFNRDIKLPRLIPQLVDTTWMEGNAPVVLRVKNGAGNIDILPLAIMHPSPYSIGGDCVMQVEVGTLKDRLSKTYPKTKKTKRSVYFENIGKEIQANFSPEVYVAYRDGEPICRMPTKYADCLRVNSHNRPYGVSPFFRCLRPLTILKTLENADASEAKARSKYIIFQKLRKEMLGSNANSRNISLAEQVVAHNNLVAALKTNLAAYTGNASVESVEFVSAKSTGEDSVKLNTTYTTKYLDSLGISWVDTELPNGTEANLSVKNLIKSINTVLNEIERVVNKFYLTMLEENGISDPMYIPSLHIAKAESLELSLKKDIAQFVYGTLNGSLTTAFKMMDLDIENEASRRIEEKAKGYEDIFTPRETAYTRSSSSGEAGRPLSTDEDTDPDKQLNGVVRRDT